MLFLNEFVWINLLSEWWVLENVKTLSYVNPSVAFYFFLSKMFVFYAWTPESLSKRTSFMHNAMSWIFVDVTYFQNLSCVWLKTYTNLYNTFASTVDTLAVLIGIFEIIKPVTQRL